MEETNGSGPAGPQAAGHQEPWTRWPRDGGGPPESWPGRRHSWHLGPSLWRRGPRGHGALRREWEDRLAGGVAGGVAAKTGFDVTTVRLAFVVAAVLSSGLGAAVYVVAWLLLPRKDVEGSIASKAMADRRGITLAAGAGSLLIVVLLLASVFGFGWLASLAWPLVIGAAGLVLIWRNAPQDEQEAMRRLTEPLQGLTAGGKRPGIALRLPVALALIIAGVVALQSAHENIKLLQPLGGVALVIAGIAVILGPWWLRIARDLVVERQARVRAEERADMASRVHDSVLQTLALIQRSAGDPHKVVQLARAQERELRSWLFDGRAPGSIDPEGMTFAAGVRLIQQEVEAQYGRAVEAITVGDCELDEDLSALLAAGREATVNAVKWSGADVVSLFAEVEAAEVSLFVRDRGQGFDPAAVPGDRKGLAESIHARMARRGGSATVRSVVGEGTEVSLTMPRTAGERQASRA